MQPSQFEPRQPDLSEAAETLEKALSEACTSKTARDASTGELIRVEEMLALASDAARRAIAIRREARLEAEATGSRGEGAATPADQSAATAHRLFEDRRGVRWDVWAVYPETRPSTLSALPGTFPSGWLVFESATEKRRLSPIPDDWQGVDPVELERLCERAELAARRARRGPGGAGRDVPPREP